MHFLRFLIYCMQKMVKQTFNKASLNKLKFSLFYTCNAIGKNLFPLKNEWKWIKDENIYIIYKLFQSAIFKSLFDNECCVQKQKKYKFI